jgi:NTP pyrophosphatase (non-canonical NTP hydrolase)
MSDLSFKEFSIINGSRCRRWHKGGIEEWSITDWATAFVGEVGEACNAIKKLRRIEDGAANINDPGRQLDDREQALASIGEELADAFIYLDILAQRLGVNLEEAIKAKFNKTSKRYGFPERLPLPDRIPVEAR